MEERQDATVEILRACLRQAENALRMTARCFVEGWEHDRL